MSPGELKKIFGRHGWAGAALLVIVCLLTYGRSIDRPYVAFCEGNEECDDWVVVRAIDGDTIEVEREGERETVRLIGINTPETVDPRREVECFGKEASNRTRELVEGKKVRLEGDSTQTDRDKYGRILRYVYLETGELVNKILVEEGYAYEYTYKDPYIFAEEFRAAEMEAKVNERGLWGGCGG